MNTKYFPNFVRTHFPEVANESNESLIKIGNVFKNYLEYNFKDKMDLLAPIWDIDQKTVVKKLMCPEPGDMKGYHPALVWHFIEFSKKVSTGLLTI